MLKRDYETAITTYVKQYVLKRNDSIQYETDYVLQAEISSLGKQSFVAEWRFYPECENGDKFVSTRFEHFFADGKTLKEFVTKQIEIFAAEMTKILSERVIKIEITDRTDSVLEQEEIWFLQK